MRRVTRHQATGGGQPISLGPNWSPDGTRLAYVSYKGDGMPRIFELNLRTGEERAVPVSVQGDYITPAYHPDGERPYFGVNGYGRHGIYSYDIVRQCCFTTVFESRSEELSPAFAPHGRTFAFNSFRLGAGAPQIYTIGADGSGRAELVSPYVYGREGYYTSPDWSPRGDRIAFHGRVFERGAHQILVADMERSGPLAQFTFEGENEDPSFGPDGRHIAYVRVRSDGVSLVILDTVTGNERTLVGGIRVRVPDWSPSLAVP
jgi:TolB protein